MIPTPSWQYDTDQLLPCYGFGGKRDRVVSHCFPLNGKPENPYVHGLSGVLDAYHLALTQWGLSGPTNFSQVTPACSSTNITFSPLVFEMLLHQVISAAAETCQRHVAAKQRVYTILLMITDGERQGQSHSSE